MMNKQRKTSNILNVFQYDETTGAVTLPSTLVLTAPASDDNSTKVGTTAWVRTYVSGLSYLTGNQSITVSGDATGSGTTSIALTLANTAVTPGTYGSATLVPVVTVDSKGRITSVTTAAISGSLTFTGDVTGSGTTGTSTGLTLAASGVTAGTYTKVTVDSKGRVTVGANASTTDISEGTRLYYTDARVLAYLGANNYATQSYVNTQVSNLVASAPAALDTLNELAAALGNDASFSTTISTALGNRLRVDINTQGLSATLQGYGRTNLGLGTAATSATGDFVAFRTFGTAANSAVGDFVAFRTFGTAANNNTGDFAAASHTHSIANVTGLQTALDGKQASLGFTPYNATNPAGYITGITSANVTTALGFTPYNATNPSGYLTQTTADARYIYGTSNPSTAGNFTLSIGNNGTYSYVQSHSGQPLELNPVGNAVRIAGNTVYHTGNIPTWNQNTTGTAASISGFNNPTTAATANTIAYRDGSGDIYGRYGFYGYVNTTDNVDTGTITHIMAKFGDNYHRSATAAKVQAFLGLGSAAYQNTGAFLSTSGSVTINGDLTVGVGGSSNIYMNDSDEGQRQIHCNSNRIGFLTQAGAWGAYADDAGNWFASNLSGTNTGDQTNISGNAATANGANGQFYIDDNYGNSIIGLYDASRYQGVFSMGAAYVLPVNGTGPGNLYGMAWSHPNAGGVAGNLNTHGLLVMENGTFLAAISGSIRARDDVRAPAMFVNGNAVIHAGNIGSQSVSYASSSGSATSASYTTYLTTNYAGGVQSNPQVYFNNGIGLKVAMTGHWSVWSDTIWVNGYAGVDVPWMCAMHFLRNSEPRMAISAQTQGSSTYGAVYELISTYNKDSQITTLSYGGASRLYTGSDGTRNTGWAYHMDNNTGLHWPNNGWHFYPKDTSDMYLRSGNGDASALVMNTAGTNRGYVYANSSNQIGFLNNSRSWIFRVHSDGRTDLGGDTQSSIFIPRHLEANTVWGSCGCLSLFLGWSSSKVVIGTGATGGHDYANGLGANSVVSTNPFYCYQDITAFSDSRVKENVEVVENAIEKIKAIRGVTFTRNDIEDKNKRHAGVIAQEVLAVLPEVVSEDLNGQYSVAYGNLNALLIEAIKEQCSIIDKLSKRIEDLENK